MEIILIFLVGALMGAFNFGFFLLGCKYQETKKQERAVEVTNENKEQIKQLFDWLNYRG